MSDFSALLRAQLDLGTAKSQMDSFINQYQNKPLKIKVEADTTGTDFTKQLQAQMQATGKSASASFNKGFNVSSLNIKDFTKLKQQLVKETSSVSKKIQTYPDVSQKDADKWAKQYVNAQQKAVAKAEAQAANAQQKAVKEAEAVATQVSKIREVASSGNFNYTNAKNQSFLDKYIGQDSEALSKARKQIEEIKKLQTELSSEKHLTESGDLGGSLSSNDTIAKYEQLKKTLTDLGYTMKEVQATSSKTLAAGVADTAGNEIQKYYQDNTKAVKKYGEALKELESRSRNATTEAELASVTREFKALDSTISAEGLNGKSWFDGIKDMGSQVAKYAGGFMSFYQGIQIAKQMVSAVYEIDTAMTNLYKVTDETSAKYDSFMKDAAKNSQDLGRSMSSYITQSSEWAKLGYTIDQATELSKTSAIYANVGEVDDATAVSDLVTAMKAYNIEANDSITIADKYNILGNEFATSAAALGEGLSNSASALALAGNGIDETLAMLTGTVEITQNASQSSNALKTLSLRIRGMKGDLQELGEEYEDIESISKMQTQILNFTNGKVNIFDDNGDFKSTYEIMKDISDIYYDLSSTDQADLLETIAGKNRANDVAALISAYSSGQVQKALETSQNSEGSAMAEQSKWLESMEAKVAQFQSAFENLSQTAISSDFLKGTVDAGTGALNMITTLIDQFGILQTLIGGFAATKGISSFFKNFDKSAVNSVRIFLKCSPIFLEWSIIAKDAA